MRLIGEGPSREAIMMIEDAIKLSARNSKYGTILGVTISGDNAFVRLNQEGF